MNAGIRKVNIGTALNVAFSGAIRAVIDADPAATDPRKYLSVGRQAIGDTVAELCRVLAPTPTVAAQGEAR